MKIIKKYVFFDEYDRYDVVLTDENLHITISPINQRYPMNVFSMPLNKVITSLQRLVAPKIDVQIFKLTANLLKNKELHEKEKRCQEFWENLNLDLIKTQKFKISDDTMFRITKNSIETVVKYGKHSYVRNVRNFCAFFFYGPLEVALPFDVRQKVKKNIFDAIDKSAINLKFSDGFVLFDYEKIKNTEFTREYFGVTDRLSFGQGFVRVETNLDTYDFNVETFSPETLWYAPDYVIPRIFEDKKDEILKVLENAIVKPAHSQEPKDNIDRDAHGN